MTKPKLTLTLQILRRSDGRYLITKAGSGDTFEEFEGILARPHQFIFNREWFDNGGGRGEPH